MRTMSRIAAGILAAGFLPGLLPLESAAYAQDVRVRVAHEVRSGAEGTTGFPTIQMALDHHPFAGKGADGKPGRIYIEIAPASTLNASL